MRRRTSSSMKPERSNEQFGPRLHHESKAGREEWRRGMTGPRPSFARPATFRCDRHEWA